MQSDKRATIEFLRRPVVEHETKHTKSDLYRLISNGVVPRPVKLSKRHAVWLNHEIQAWKAAVASGASKQELRTLVAELEKTRKDFHPSQEAI